MTYWVSYVLPAVSVRQPVSIGPAILCTTAHLNQFEIEPASEADLARQVAANARTAHGEAVEEIGIMLFENQNISHAIKLGLLRVCREALALAFVTKGTALCCHHGQASSVYNADYFDPLPIQFRETHILIRRPGLLAFGTQDEALRFSFPHHLPPADTSMFQLDEVLLRNLERAIRSYSRGNKVRLMRQIFRSITYALHGTRIMPDPDSNYFDLGIRIVSWVASFETLVHPGQGRVGLSEVFIEEVHWNDDDPGKLRQSSLNHKRLKVTWNKRISRENAPCRMYRILYKLRNDLAHGNRIRPGELEVGRTNEFFRTRIDQLMPLLYRGCLVERLRQIGIVRRIPQGEGLTQRDFQAFVGERINASTFDKALSNAIFNRIAR